MQGRGVGVGVRHERIARRRWRRRRSEYSTSGFFSRSAERLKARHSRPLPAEDLGEHLAERRAVWVGKASEPAHDEAALDGGEHGLQHRRPEQPGRMYDSGAFAVFDDEVYEAISLVVPSIDEPRTFEIERDDILATYSWVSAVDPNYGCFGYARSGSVTIGPHDDRRVRVEMLVEVASKAREVYGDECRDLEISDDATYEIKDFRDLTPWHGGPSRDPYWGTAPDPDPEPRPAAPDPSTL